MFTIIPKERVFFDLFEQAAGTVRDGAGALLELLERFDEVPQRAKRVKDIEHRGDEITHRTMERLNQTFITPLDREDIHELITTLDDILDMIDTAANRIALYRVQRPGRDAIALGQCLVHATARVESMVKLLRTPKAVEEVLRIGREVHAQENAADQILQHALAALFTEEPDPREIIKWKDIYQELEGATDRCEDVGNIIEGIVLKNA